MAYDVAPARAEYRGCRCRSKNSKTIGYGGSFNSFEERIDKILYVIIGIWPDRQCQMPSKRTFQWPNRSDCSSPQADFHERRDIRHFLATGERLHAFCPLVNVDKMTDLPTCNAHIEADEQVSALCLNKPKAGAYEATKNHNNNRLDCDCALDHSYG